jgi:hypothetical protein
MLEINGEIVKIYLQDIDGITVNSVTYKLAQGAKIFIPLKKYPTIGLSSNVGLDTDISKPVDSNTSFTEMLGNVSNTGHARPSITLDALIPIDSAIKSETQYFGSPSNITNTQIVSVNYYLLFLMWLHNHRIYLTDVDAEESYPNLGLPLNILMNRKDYFGNDIFKSTGVPVIITKLNITGQMLDLKSSDNINTAYLECKIELTIDNYGA